MAELSVATTYANALYEVASEVGKTEKIADEFDEIVELIKGQRDLELLVVSPAVPVGDKQEVLEKLFAGRVSQELVNFLCVVVGKNRGTELDKMAKMYRKTMNEREGFSTGMIYSAIKLKKDQLAQFEEKTGELLQEKVKLINEVDKRIIGGVKIYIDGKLIDASIRNSLDKLLEEIKSNE